MTRLRRKYPIYVRGLERELKQARLNGKQMGQKGGTTFVTKKSIEAKEKIKKYNKTFGGSLNKEETWKLLGISKMTFYKYKDELLHESE
ncbi:MAG: hypothetical protein ACLTBV_32575 [Enterocloster bolteae]